VQGFEIRIKRKRRERGAVAAQWERGEEGGKMIAAAKNSAMIPDP